MQTPASTPLRESKMEGRSEHNSGGITFFLSKQRGGNMNSTEKTLILIAGSVMIVSGLFGVMSWSDRTGKLYGFGSWGQYAVAGHWWVLLFVGLIFSFTPLLSGPNNSKGVDQRLVRMAADLKKLKKQIEHYSTRDGVFSQHNTSDNNPPEIDAVGNPDEEGYEWITSEDGANYYRTIGSSDEWVKFEN